MALVRLSDNVFITRGARNNPFLLKKTVKGRLRHCRKKNNGQQKTGVKSSPLVFCLQPPALTCHSANAYNQHWEQIQPACKKQGHITHLLHHFRILSQTL
ncbi:hypothetical protein AMECASPLE_038378 [Ameca splendens]|uniref:Uncharacterized protein n=1 Tax=Ameca splendens TaxID=208324 RepID=A0ABV0XX22_9TELE